MSTQQPSSQEFNSLHAALRPELEKIAQKAAARLGTANFVDKTFYHYTTLDGLRGIVESGRIWATDLRYLNDAKELVYSNQLISMSLTDRAKAASDPEENELIERLIRTFDFREGWLGVFSTSFSEVDDDLGQWRGYAGGTGGVALGFDFSWSDQSIEMIKIEYDENKQKSLVRDLIDDIISSFRKTYALVSPNMMTFMKAEYCGIMRVCAADLLLRFKDRHWRGEAEWRLVTALARFEQREQLRFRSGHFGLVPYIEVSPIAQVGVFHGRLPLVEVILGPHRYQDLSLESLRAYLNANGYSEVFTKVRVSDVPLRF